MLWSLLIISLIALCNTCHLKLHGTTSQSSVYNNLTSERAIDGNLEECAHTIEVAKSWWRIDLLGVYSISNISIYNKQHHNARIRARILIGNSRESNSTTNSLCQNITNLTLGSWNHFHCNTNMSGRYITVFSPEEAFLVLCEVKIFGTKQESPFILIKMNMTWENALYHCREKCGDLASILDKDTQTWAELEAREANTPFVWLALHYSCILEFWFWVSDHRLEFNRWDPKNKAGGCDMSGAMATQEDHLWFSMSDNKTFGFICTKKDESQFCV